MQKQRLKILLGLAFALFACSFSSAQPHAVHLKQADSLFSKKQYTQSLEKYTKLFQAGVYSPAMLLRMSRIEEGLGHTARSLYYLNLNYLATHDDRVLEKIQEVAARNNLEGYEESVVEKTMAKFEQHQMEINLVLLALIVFCFAIAVYQKRKRATRPVFAFSTLAACVIVLVYVNTATTSERGIVTQAPIYLMSGPSGGADVLAIVGPGHRLTVEGKHDVWLKVQWGEKQAFIKKSQLLPVAL